MPSWVTSTGRRIPVHLMSQHHLTNAVTMLRRNLYKGIRMPSSREKLRMLLKEMERRGMTDHNAVVSGWHVRTTNGKAHWVNVYDGVLAPMSKCGHKSKKWYEAHEGDDKCQKCLQLTGESDVRVKKTKPREQEIHVDFVQQVGPVIPLCWIPIDDIAAVVNLLNLYRPGVQMKVALAQIDATIDKLNAYVGEAIARNNRPSSMTFTYNDDEKK